MSIEQKAGQLLIVGFAGQDHRQLEKTIQEVRPGALIVFGHNIKSAKQISLLNDFAQKNSMQVTGVPLFVAVDQEGGEVIRIRTANALPSALALGETNNPLLVRESGERTGNLLKVLGFNMNLAPVLDISNPDEPSFIGTRSFGQDPNRVGIMGESFALGLKGAGVLPTAKHFPGHGGVNEDSHRVLPKKMKTLDQLLAFDLQPFKRLGENLKEQMAIMAAHIAFPNLDPSGQPATYSSIILTKVLRESLGYKGLVMTDDIEMSAASQIQDVGERAVRAVLAGADLVMVVWTPQVKRQVHAALVKAIKEKRITEERLNASLQRILSAKKYYGKGLQIPPSPSDSQIMAALKDPQFEQTTRKVTEAILNQELTNETQQYLSGTNKDILIFTATADLYRDLRRASPHRKFKLFTLAQMTPSSIRQALNANPASPAIFYLTGGKSSALLRKLDPQVAKRLVVLNARPRSELLQTQKYQSVVQLYSKHSHLGSVFADYALSPAPKLRRPAKYSLK